MEERPSQDRRQELELLIVREPKNEYHTTNKKQIAAILEDLDEYRAVGAFVPPPKARWDFILMTADNVKAVAIGVAALAAVFVAYKIYKGGAAAVKAAAAALDPTSTENIFYKGVGKIGEAVSGQEGWSLGTWLYDVTHSQQVFGVAAGAGGAKNYDDGPGGRD